MNSFRVDISEWYGSGAGLNGIQLFQDAMFSYAVNNFNEARNCGATGTLSTSSSTGNWQVSPSHNNNSQYRTTVLQGDPIRPDAASVTSRRTSNSRATTRSLSTHPDAKAMALAEVVAASMSLRQSVRVRARRPSSGRPTTLTSMMRSTTATLTPQVASNPLSSSDLPLVKVLDH